MPTINAPLYPGFVADTLRRIEHNEKPVTDLTDMAAVMELVEAVYRASPLPQAGHPAPTGLS